MSNLQIIDKRTVLEKDFKIYGDFENPLFLAKDVAEWIDYSKSGNGSYNVSQMLSTIDDDEKLVSTLLVGGQNREVILLTEDGLYEVLMQSRKPIAKKFKKKIKEILKEIRITGTYTANPDKALDREIKLKNARVREASIFLRIADAKDTEPIYRGILKAKAVEVVAGERLLPYPVVIEKTYTATEVAQLYNISSANMVGKICNKLGLKAPEGESNECGHWIHNKSQHSSREVKSWVYNKLGAERIKDYAVGQMLTIEN